MGLIIYFKQLSKGLKVEKLISKSEVLAAGGVLQIDDQNLLQTDRHQLYSSDNVDVEVKFAGSYESFGTGISGFNLIDISGIDGIKITASNNNTTVKLVSVHYD